MRLLPLILAYMLDMVLGDPRGFVHPVQIMGRGIQGLEGLFLPRVKSPILQVVLGGLTTLIIVVGTYLATDLMLRLAVRGGNTLALVVEAILLYFSLATRSLGDHAGAIFNRLSSEDLPGARQAVAQVVGRDTDSLSEEGVARAAIETVAENLSDGVIAPLFYAVLGGAPLAMTYKAVNTLDSMVGYKSPRYLYFGRVAARLDDIANIIPARLTGLLLAFAGSRSWADVVRSLSTMRRDAIKHPSPNSGYPEAAMAGLLDVRLGGVNYYEGVPSQRPEIRYEGRLPVRSDIQRSMKTIYRTSLSALALVIAIRWLLIGVWGW